MQSGTRALAGFLINLGLLLSRCADQNHPPLDMIEWSCLLCFARREGGRFRSHALCGTGPLDGCAHMGVVAKRCCSYIQRTLTPLVATESRCLLV